MEIVSAVGYTLCRVPVDSVVCKSMMFSSVIVDITISRFSFVFSQSCLEVPASLSDVGGLAVRAFDLVNPHPDDHTTRSTVTPGFKPFTEINNIDFVNWKIK